MSVSINTARIAQHFAKAGQSYVEHAVVQKQISKQLFDYLKQYFPQALPSVLEIGCGSGNLTQLCNSYFQVDQLFLNDLYEDVDQHFCNPKNINWLIGNIEQLTLPTQLDAVISSAALQWMSEPNAYLGFSTFGLDNLTEIKQLTGQGLSYSSLDELKQQLEQNGFEVLLIESDFQYLYFEHPKAVLQHLKATGVTATSQNYRWAKQSLQQFYIDYEQFRDDHGYRLTYHPIYVIARRTT